MSNELKPLPGDAHLKYAIEQLVKDIDALIKERDAAIEELRSMSDNCFCCRWADGNSCKSPNLCLSDDNPDRWEWRGVTND